MSDDPRSIGESLDRVLRALGSPPADVLEQLASAWGTVVGVDLAAHSHPDAIVDGRLAVQVDAPVVATALRYQEAAILGWLDRVAGPAVVTRIDVRVVGTVTPPW